MNLEELRTVQRTERQKDSLQHLDDAFYRDAAAYIADLKDERDRTAAQVDNPYSAPEVKRLTDRIETAEEVVESIYERRVGKVVKRASFTAAGMAADEEGLTSEERNLFEDLVDRIETNRRTVLDAVAGEGDGDATTDADPQTDTESTTDAEPTADAEAATPTPDESAAPETPPDPDDLLAEAMGSGEGVPDAARAPDDDPSPTPDGGDAAVGVESGAEATPGADATPETDDRTTLRITRDVGEIVGVDERSYDLEREDVVRLPTANADPLVERDAAERVD
jgi:DNA replication factor GINS